MRIARIVIATLFGWAFLYLAATIFSDLSVSGRALPGWIAAALTLLVGLTITIFVPEKGTRNIALFTVGGLLLGLGMMLWNSAVVSDGAFRDPRLDIPDDTRAVLTHAIPVQFSQATWTAGVGVLVLLLGGAAQLRKRPDTGSQASPPTVGH